MTILEKIKFEEDWLSEVNLTKENIKIAFAGIRATALESQRWIPVCEKLPEEYIHVLCQFTLSGMGECYLAHGVFHVVGGLVMTCNEVVAWMPLPQPYKAESEVCKMTNEEMLSSFDTREKARWIAMWRGWEGNKEEVDYWENWLKSEVQDDE